MITIRKGKDRGNSKTSWLDSFHTFSFGDYRDANFMGFGNLRVINEDTVQPGNGFGRHGHQNMEIISYVIEGSLAHSDSLGTGSVIKPGEIQRMSAGSGVEHSEYNHSKTELLHFLQIWIIPESQQLAPSYEQKSIPQIKNQLILIGSQDGKDNAITIHQNLNLFAAYLTSDNLVSYSFKQGHSGWLQLVKGKVTLENQTLLAGDGAAIADVANIHITCLEDAEFLLFDFAKE